MMDLVKDGFLNQVWALLMINVGVLLSSDGFFAIFPVHSFAPAVGYRGRGN